MTDIKELEDKVERLEDRALELEAGAKRMRNLQLFHAFALALIGVTSCINYFTIN